MKHASLFSQFDSLLFVDTETSGLSPKADQIIELAALHIAKDGSVFEMDDLIPLPDGQQLNPQIVSLTHITDQMLQELGKPPKEVCATFSKLLQPNTLLIAYNAQFDLTFLYYFLHSFGQADRLRNIRMLDALTVYKDRKEYPHRLEHAIAAYHLEDKVINSHRAIDDTRALQAVVEAMEEEEDDLLQYLNLFGYNPKFGISGPRISSVTYLPQGYQRQEKLYLKK